MYSIRRLVELKPESGTYRFGNTSERLRPKICSRCENVNGRNVNAIANFVRRLDRCCMARSQTLWAMLCLRVSQYGMVHKSAMKILARYKCSRYSKLYLKKQMCEMWSIFNKPPATSTFPLDLWCFCLSNSRKGRVRVRYSLHSSHSALFRRRVIEWCSLKKNIFFIKTKAHARHLEYIFENAEGYGRNLPGSKRLKNINCFCK